MLLRTFIAIELPKEIKATLAELQNHLKTSGADIKWVEPENIHLTLKFLGERDEKKIQKITKTLVGVAAEKKSYLINVASLGGFPKLSSPRVIWVGIDQGDIDTKDIVKALEEEIAKVGIPKEERPFSSHITIGRTRSNINFDKFIPELAKIAKTFPPKKQEFLVDKITLFKSQLTPGGPVYEVLKAASLKTA